jgi:predicted secreted Zn-dependent protease
MLRLASALLLVGCAHLPTPVETVESAPAPGVHLTERVVTYAVRGRDIRALRQSMSRIGPIDDADHQHQFAKTWGTFAWSYPNDKKDGACATGPVSVELEVVQTYPDWVARTGARASTVAEWNRWMTALKDHEEGHRRLLVDTAKKMSRQLRALPASATCEELDTAANALGGKLLQDMRDAHRDFDKTTRHGASTGAQLRNES